jgi:hypothetical protein
MPAEKTTAVELAYDGGSLRLGAGPWCYLSLLQNGGAVRRLGAEVRTNVVNGLLRGLVAPIEGAPVGTLDGVEVYRLLSLSEDGAKVFVSHGSGGRSLWIQDEAGELVARVDLPDQVIEKWIEALGAC